MRILLDENVDRGLVEVLGGLRHHVEHVGALPYKGANDIQLVELAQQFDVFITLDLHRQEAEWAAVNRALVDGKIKVIRIKMPPQKESTLQDLAQSLFTRIDQWMAHIQAGMCLITISDMGTRVRAHSHDDVVRMLSEWGQQ